MNFRNIFSYLFPFTVAHSRGKLTPNLQVTYINGKYELGTPGVNYSYGGCGMVFSKVFKQIEIQRYPISSLLVLGFGAGNVVSILSEVYGKSFDTLGVEGDPIVIEYAKKYFDIDRFPRLKLVEADAYDFALNHKEKHDVIIIDLFQNDVVPEIFHTEPFIKALRHIATPKSLVIFNKMTHKPHMKEEVILLGKTFEKWFESVEIVRVIVNGKENSVVVCNTLLEN